MEGSSPLLSFLFTAPLLEGVAQDKGEFLSMVSQDSSFLPEHLASAKLRPESSTLKATLDK